VLFIIYLLLDNWLYTYKRGKKMNFQVIEQCSNSEKELDY